MTAEKRKTDTRIPQLPIDVIIHVMSYLGVSDRMAAGLVNRMWREASLSSKFLDEELLCVGSPRGDEMKEVFPLLQRSSRPFYHITFKEVELKSTMALWEQHGPSIRSLCLLCCDLSEKTLVEILRRCENLRTLHISSCRECLMSGRLLEEEHDVRELSAKLQFLRKLNLTYNRYLSDALFNRFVSICRNLEWLELTGCEISYHHGLYKKFYANKDDHIVCPSESVLTFFHVLRYIASQAHKLKHLDFGNTLMDGNALASLSKVEALRLESLKLRSCDQLTIVGIRELTRHQTHLKSLDVSLCTRITDASLIVICKYLTELRILKIRRCRGVTNCGVQQIRMLENLHELDISECEQLTSECITRGLCAPLEEELSERGVRINEKMDKFSASALNLDELSIECITECYRNLKLLDVGYCFTAITDVTAQAIFQKLVLLRTLRISHCDRISDAGLMGTENTNISQSDATERSSERLLRISLRSRAEEDIVRDADRKQQIMQFCRNNVSSTHSNFVGSCSFSLTQIKGLRELDLSGCNRITDISLEHSFAFIELKILNLSKCQQITHVGLKYLAKNNPAIEDLNLTRCYNVSDMGLWHITVELRRLKRLHLQGCSQLTNQTLDYVKEHCRCLRYLDVRCCEKMTVAGIEACTEGSLHLEIEHTRSTETTLSLDNGVGVPLAPPLPRIRMY